MRVLVRLARLSVRLLGALLAASALVALLVGLPWGLWTYLGWPLPDHLPTRNEIEAVLLNPLSVTVLLDILGCVAWAAWAVFVIDVVRCAPDVARGVRPPSTGPIHAVAVFLVVATLVGVLGQRGAVLATATLPAREQSAPVTRYDTVAPSVQLLVSNMHTTDHESSSDRETVTVRPPRNGVHDSLWRIARRELGDGTRWRKLFEINRGRVQAGGERLTDPSLIRPGWVLLMPVDDPVTVPKPTRPEGSKRPTPPTPSVSSPEPESESISETVPEQSVRSENSRSSNSVGITLVTGGFLSAVLASAVTGAVLARRRRRLRGYRSREDSEPTSSLAPVVRALRVADDQHRLALDAEGPDDSLSVVTAPTVSPSSTSNVEIGTHHGYAYAVDLAASHGLGVTGAGAEAAVRALLVHLLGTTSAIVVIPEGDAITLLGAELPDSSRLRITADLDDALDVLSNGLERERTDELTAVLVTRIEGTTSRLQSLLDNGAEHGIAGIVLGHWPAGGTVRVREDGTVAAASPTMDGALHEARLFHVDATDTRELINLFSDAVPRQPEVSKDEDLGDLPPEPDSADDVDGVEPEEFCGGELLPARGGPVEMPDSAEPGPSEQPIATWTHDDLTDQDTRIDGSELTPQRPLTLTVFGQVTLHQNTSDGPRDLTSLLAPKHKALLVLLALYPTGTTRESVREAMWPDARQRRPFNAFYATVSQIRKILANATDEQTTDLIDQRGEHVALVPELVEVDYWRLHEAERDQRNADTTEQRLAACSRIVAAYRGELATDMTFLWLDGPREAAHRDAVDALASMAAHYRGVDPERQLQLLEHARLLNPENEDIYRDIMRVQAELGHTDAISRTLHLLTTALAGIGTKPESDTLMLARALQTRQRHRVSEAENQ